MKMRYNILLAMAAFAVVACTNDATLGVDNVEVDRNAIEVGATGGVEKVKIAASGQWVASLGTNTPWITISPANGRGSVTCDFIIDSALTVNSRMGVVTIKHLDSGKECKINVSQNGYDYSLEVDNNDIQVKKYQHHYIL